MVFKTSGSLEDKRTSPFFIPTGKISVTPSSTLSCDIVIDRVADN